jgi:hypothetical protein
MAENKNQVRNGIIITVVGGLILAASLKLIPSLWNWLVNFLRNFWQFLFLKIELSTWLFLLFLTASLYTLFKLSKYILSFFPKKTQSPQQTPEPDKSQEIAEPEKKEDSSSKEERYIVALFAKTDGRSLSVSEIQRGIGSNNIRTSHALERLLEKNIIERYGGPYSPVEYALTTKGRGLIINLDWDKEFQK